VWTVEEYDLHHHVVPFWAEEMREFGARARTTGYRGRIESRRRNYRIHGTEHLQGRLATSFENAMDGVRAVAEEMADLNGILHITRLFGNMSAYTIALL
jgi:hypothetical protein